MHISETRSATIERQEQFSEGTTPTRLQSIAPAFGNRHISTDLQSLFSGGEAAFAEWQSLAGKVDKQLGESMLSELDPSWHGGCCPG